MKLWNHNTIKDIRMAEELLITITTPNKDVPLLTNIPE
jgi:hypothetical protein